jgi:hypothetical protein
VDEQEITVPANEESPTSLERRILAVLGRDVQRSSIMDLEAIAKEVSEAATDVENSLRSLERKGFVLIHWPRSIPVVPELLSERWERSLSDLLVQLRKITAIQNRTDIKKHIQQKVLKDVARRIDVACDSLVKTSDELQRQLDNASRDITAISDNIDEVKLRAEIGDLPDDEAKRLLESYEKDLQAAKRTYETLLENFRKGRSSKPREALMTELANITVQKQLQWTRYEVGELSEIDYQARSQELQKSEREIESRLSAGTVSPADSAAEILKIVANVKSLKVMPEDECQEIENRLKKIFADEE